MKWFMVAICVLLQGIWLGCQTATRAELVERKVQNHRLEMFHKGKLEMGLWELNPEYLFDSDLGNAADYDLRESEFRPILDRVFDGWVVSQICWPEFESFLLRDGSRYELWLDTRPQADRWLFRDHYHYDQGEVACWNKGVNSIGKPVMRLDNHKKIQFDSMLLFPPTGFSVQPDGSLMLQQKVPGPKIRNRHPSPRPSMARRIAKGLRVGQWMEKINNNNYSMVARKIEDTEGWLFFHFSDDSLLGIHHQPFGGRPVVVGFGLIQHSFANVMTVKERCERIKQNGLQAELSRQTKANFMGMGHDAPTLRESVERLIPGWQVKRSRGSGGYQYLFMVDFFKYVMELDESGGRFPAAKEDRVFKWIWDEKNVAKLSIWVDREKKKEARFQDFLADQIPGLFEKQTMNKP